MSFLILESRTPSYVVHVVANCVLCWLRNKLVVNTEGHSVHNPRKESMLIGVP